MSLDQIQDWRRRYKHGHEDWVLTTATIWHQRKGLVPLVLFCLVVDADGTAQ